MKAIIHGLKALQDIASFFRQVLLQLREVLHTLLTQQITELRFKVREAISLKRFK